MSLLHTHTQIHRWYAIVTHTPHTRTWCTSPLTHHRLTTRKELVFHAHSTKTVISRRNWLQKEVNWPSLEFVQHCWTINWFNLCILPGTQLISMDTAFWGGGGCFDAFFFFFFLWCFYIYITHHLSSITHSCWARTRTKTPNNKIQTSHNIFHHTLSQQWENKGSAEGQHQNRIYIPVGHEPQLLFIAKA